jgi:hypothetical protein
MDLSKITKLPNDVGGNEAGPIKIVDHELLPWEKRCHALLDILDTNKIINTEEKRRGVEDLGKELISQNGYYERWIMAAANILMQKQLITPDEIARKTSEVEQRLKQ